MISLTDDEFVEISRYIKTNYGVNLENKKPLIEGRLSHFIYGLGFESYREYFDSVKADSTGKALDSMLNRLTTNHTYFMREEEHFSFFEKTILPWVDNTLKDHDLRLWSAGCSSGEEPYVLSMILFDYIKHSKAKWDTTILATDISSKALQTGQQGEYTADAISAISDEWKAKYFKPTNTGTYKVSDEIRKNVVFRKFNLLDNFTNKKLFHTIFCRNVMIYFDNETKTQITQKFYDALCDGGYFLIGHSESLSSINTRFKYISPSLYRKE